MNSSNPLSNDEENAEDSAIIPSTKRTQFLATYRQQTFPFRASIMRYLAKNPTLPKTYLKMIKTCKFFFVQNPIIIPGAPFYDGVEGQNKADDNFEPKIDFSKLKSKFWIAKRFTVRVQKDGDQNIISSLIPKIFRYDAKELFIENQIISLNDYVYLASSVEGVLFKNVTVKNENGFIIPFEKIVETVSKATLFCYTNNTTCSNITSKTFGKLIKLPHFVQFRKFCIRYIPECFDLAAFYAYMKQNQRTSFALFFDAFISEAYKNRLAEIVDEILATKNPEYCIPLIHFPGMNREKHFKLMFLSR